MTGFKVYRKLWHMSAVWVPLVYWHAVPKRTAVSLALAAFIIALAIDIVRLSSQKVNNFFFNRLGMLIRESERKNLNTSTYFIFSCLLVIVLFDKRIATVSMLFLALGDPAAALIGSKYGTIKLFEKSLQGSLACFFVCFFSAQWILPVGVAFWASLCASIFELLSSKINDNISIPVFSGFAMDLLLKHGGEGWLHGYAATTFEVYLYFVVATSFAGIVLRHFIVRHYKREIDPFTGGTQRDVEKELPGDSTCDDTDFPSVSIIIYHDSSSSLEYGTLHFPFQNYTGRYEVIHLLMKRGDKADGKDSGNAGSNPIESDLIRNENNVAEMKILEVNLERGFPGRHDAWIAAMKQASGEIIVFMDAEGMPGPDFIESMVCPLGKDNVGMTVAVPFFEPNRGIGSVLQSLVGFYVAVTFYYPTAFWSRFRTATCAATAIKRKTLELVGGIDNLPRRLTACHMLAEAVIDKGKSIHLSGKMLSSRPTVGTLSEWWNFTRAGLTLIRRHEPYLYPLYIFQTGTFHAFLLIVFFHGPIYIWLFILSMIAEAVSLWIMMVRLFGGRGFIGPSFMATILSPVTPFIWAAAYLPGPNRISGERLLIGPEGRVNSAD